VFVTCVLVVTLAMTIGPASTLVALDEIRAQPSTRIAAEHWIDRHLAPGTKVAVEIDGPDLTGTPYHQVEHYSLPRAGSIADYARAGYRYLVVNAGLAREYRLAHAEHPAEAAFYEFLRDEARVVARFRRNHAHGGPNLVIYDLGPSATPTDRDAASDGPAVLVTLRPTLANRVMHGGGPVPFDRHQLRRLALGLHV
jgi:hypothetical protein